MGQWKQYKDSNGNVVDSVWVADDAGNLGPPDYTLPGAPKPVTPRTGYNPNDYTGVQKMGYAADSPYVVAETRANAAAAESDAAIAEAKAKAAAEPTKTVVPTGPRIGSDEWFAARATLTPAQKSAITAPAVTTLPTIATMQENARKAKEKSWNDAQARLRNMSAWFIGRPNAKLTKTYRKRV